MGLSDPQDVAAHEKKLADKSVEPPSRLTSKIRLSAYSAEWPNLCAREETRIRGILADRIVRMEHVGSTAVRGLPAKPIIDIALEVARSSDEASYVVPLEAAGYRLAIREPDWFEHRVLKGPDTNVNLHVFSAGCAETDRDLYAKTKLELATHDWTFVQQNADAKTADITEIMNRAR